MNLLPDKNLFVVTSALNTGIGIVSPEDRFAQTIEGLKNLKNKAPNDIIMFVDGSPNPIDEKYIDEIAKYVDISSYYGRSGPVFDFASSGRKSEAEIALLFYALAPLKTNPEMSKMLTSVKRVFKYSARSLLNDDFDSSKYDGLFGRYVFKTAIPSWMDENKKTNITDHLYITRFYSFCPSLLDDYLSKLQMILDSIIQYNIDTEHSHYLCIDRRYVTEFDTLGVEGIMGGTGLKEIY
jgi:hypothetical protein